MISRLRIMLSARFSQFFLYRFIRIYISTFRIRVENEKEWVDYLKSGGRVLLCGWHQQFFPAIRYFQTYKNFKPALMISKSSDGEIIAGVAERSGWHAVRGSSSRDGKKALKEMIYHLSQFGMAGHIVDGPKGPAGIVKAGVIQLAYAADAAIVPFYTSATRAWHFNSWDYFLLPKPFAKVVISFGNMIHVGPFFDECVFERERLSLQETMRSELIIKPVKAAS